MTKLSDFLLRCAMLCMVASFLPTAAQAQQVGQGIVCDTAELAEKFVAFTDSATLEQALIEVNLEAKYPTACMMMQFAFIGGTEIATHHAKVGTIRIIEVIMVAMRTAKGFERTPPTSQFVLVLIPSQGA